MSAPTDRVNIPAASGSHESIPGLTDEPGYLGLVQKAVEVDWDLVARHGPCVLVEPRSPAYIGGLRSGDFIKTINHQSFAAFHASTPGAGTPYAIVAYRKSLGTIRTFGTIGSLPKANPAPAWQKSPPILTGKPVERKERPAFVGWLSKHRNLRPCDTILMLALIEFDGPKGAIPKHGTIAKHLNCSIRSVKRRIERCKYFGVLRVESGKCRRTSNSYTACWPAGHKFKPCAETQADLVLLARPEAVRLADDVLKIVGLHHDDRRAHDAIVIVESWLAQGWDSRLILMVVNAIMRDRKKANDDGDWRPHTLKYFERAIREAYGGK